MASKKEIRRNFRDAVFSRDNNSCRVCGKKDDALDAHHIINRNDIVNGGYVKENGISLCSECHLKAETYYFGDSEERETYKDFSPEKLFDLISSSCSLAFEKAEKLK